MSAPCNFVFYEKGQFPHNWTASPRGDRSPDIASLIKALLDSPLYGSGPFLGPRYYNEGGLRQVSFLPTVREEPVFCWDQNAKREGVQGEDQIVIRGAQYVAGRWVVYYSMTETSTLYLILYEMFQTRVQIHPPKAALPKYNIVVGGPGLVAAVQEALERENP